MSGSPVSAHILVLSRVLAVLAAAACALPSAVQASDPKVLAPKPLPQPASQPSVPPEAAAAAKPATAISSPGWPKTLPEAKAEAAAADKPDVYAPDEILLAKAHCMAILKGLDVVVLHEQPIKSGNCGTPAPVQLISIGRNPQVALTPPAIVTCDMVATMHSWVTKDLQPLAKKHLGANIIGIETMSSYSCRNAYGRKRTNLSEHGRANALDIGGFVTVAAKAADVLAHWGPTAREIRAQIVAAQAAAAAAKLAADKAAAETAAAVARARPPAQPGVAVPATIANGGGSPSNAAIAAGTVGTIIDGVPGLAARMPGAAQGAESRSGFGLMRPSQLGGPKATTEPRVLAPGASVAADGLSQAQTAQFLRNAHTAACKRFGTVLGPESNLAHRNHFHIDMAERKSGNFCE